MSPLEFMQRQAAPVTDLLSRTREASASDCFMGVNFSSHMPGLGRPLPTADVGFPVAQLGGLFSGGELERPTGAGRPKRGV
jgi:hypothetical protein